MNVRKLTLAIGVLLLAALACSNPFSSATPTTDQAALDTVVAATLTASAGGGEMETGDTPEVPTPTATDSPPLLRIVYIDNGEVWLWTEGSGAAQLTSSGGLADEVIISDDGDVVVYKRNIAYGDDELWAVNSDGTSDRLLVSLADFDAMSNHPDSVSTTVYAFDWVPGTHTVAFNTREIFEGPGLILNDDLRLVDADSLMQSTLLSPGDGGAFTYSPDGSQIALVTSTDVSFVDADGSNRRDAVLTFPIIFTYSEYNYYPTPFWLPDSSGLRIAIPSEAQLDAGATTTLWHLPVSGAAPTALWTFSPAPFFVDPVTFSPDTLSVAYIVQVGPLTDNTYELHIASPDGSGDTIYHTAPLANFTSWNPDSTDFVFSFGEPTNKKLGQVGSGFIPLTDTANADQVVWIDATRFLFTTGSIGAWELRLRQLGAPSVLIASPVGDFVSFDFTK